jgi:hypothetical protein
MRDFGAQFDTDIDDLKTRAGRPSREVGPREMAALLTESAELLPGLLLGAATFTVVALATTVVWLTVGASVLAVALGLRALWHTVFLVRAGLAHRDGQAAVAAELARVADEHGIDPEQRWW